MTGGSKRSPPTLHDSVEELFLWHIFVSVLSPPGPPVLWMPFSWGAGDDQTSRISSDSRGPPRPSVSLTDFIVVRTEYYL